LSNVGLNDKTWFEQSMTGVMRQANDVCDYFPLLGHGCSNVMKQYQYTNVLKSVSMQHLTVNTLLLVGKDGLAVSDTAFT